MPHACIGLRVQKMTMNEKLTMAGLMFRSTLPELLCEQDVLRNFAQENTCAGVSFLINLQASDLQVY